MSSTEAPPILDLETARKAAALRRDWALFTALTFLFGFGFAVYMGVFTNFLRDVVHADPLQYGRLESLRESLREVELAHLAGVSDAGLGALRSLPRLARVRVERCGRVTEGGVEELRRSLPGEWRLVDAR